nr:hypothetical protein [Tanacetum cinerariifolium]
MADEFESSGKYIDNKSDEEEEIREHGLKKKIIKEGDGWEMPLNGDEVEVHYVGSLLDGTRFDSSFDREMPFKFKLGLGHVIQGWDDGIKTMKKGEKAFFTIPPALAYVKYEARLEDGSLVTKSEEVEFIVKDGCFCPALSRAVKTMKKREKSLLTVKPQYAFGENGREPASGNDCIVSQENFERW